MLLFDILFYHNYLTRFNISLHYLCHQKPMLEQKNNKPFVAYLTINESTC